MDPDEDSDNSSVYVQGLGDNVTLEDLADFFKQCGVVKVRSTTARPLEGGKGLSAPPHPAPSRSRRVSGAQNLGPAAAGCGACSCGKSVSATGRGDRRGIWGDRA